MKSELVDTNVIVRFFVEDPETTQEKFKGVFSFFRKVEMGEITVDVSEIVVAEVFYVLVKTYKVARKDTAQKLHTLLSFRGILMRDKDLMLSCLKTLQSKNVGFVDAYLIGSSHKKGRHAVYSYDSALSKHGLKLLEIE